MKNVARMFAGALLVTFIGACTQSERALRQLNGHGRRDAIVLIEYTPL
jgi:outer membrane lipoprotein-sorting protein